MAISDILTRIDADASAEADTVLATARAEAERLASDAAASIARDRTAVLERAGHDAAEEAATMLANARLEARDALLGAKRELADAALDGARTALESLPDREYLALIEEGVAGAAAGGTMLSIASADTKRLADLPARLAKRGVKVALAGEPAPLERGVLLTGDRLRVEVSPASLIEDRRDELLLVAARALFGGASGGGE